MDSVDTVVVSGRFVNHDGSPVKGHIEFVPSRLWVNYHGEAWATLSPSVDLDAAGEFEVEITPTHGHDGYQWHYQVTCPVGKWSIFVQESEKPIGIKSLLPSKFSA